MLVLSRLKAMLHAARRAKEARPVDVYQLHDPELIPLGWWLKLTTRSKVIYDSAENYTAYMKQKYFLPAPVRALLALGMGMLESSAALLFDAIVTADQGTTDIFEKRGSKNVVTLHNFPVLDIFDIPPVDDADKQFDLVYHGSIPRYHLEVALDVASELKKRGRAARWLFFGVCHDTEWFFEQAKARGLEGLFEIRGRVNHDEVAPLVAEGRIGFNTAARSAQIPAEHSHETLRIHDFANACRADQSPAEPSFRRRWQSGHHGRTGQHFRIRRRD